MRTLLFGLIWLSPPFIKKLLLQWFCGARIGRHAQIGWFSAVMARQIELGDHCVIRPLTLIHLSGEFKLGDYGEISSFNLIYGSSSLILGQGSYIGPQSLINADEPVRLGDESALGPRSMIFTHGSFLPYTEGYWAKLAGVTLGNKVWCAAGVFIHPGVEIGNDSFVNSNPVVTQSIPPGSVVEGNPARVIYPIERVKRKMSPRRVDAALCQVLRDFAEIGLRRELEIKDVQEAEGQLAFHWRGSAYRITLIPSTGMARDFIPTSANARQIAIVNLAGWSPPPGALTLDMASRQTRFISDRIHTELRLFMLRYYGIKFKEAGYRPSSGW